MSRCPLGFTACITSPAAAACRTSPSPTQAYGACEQGTDHAAVLGRIVQGLGLSRVMPRALAHPDPRIALRSVLQ